MIVTDTNVVVYSVIPGVMSASADAVYAKDQVWVVPPLARSELRNALALHVRFRQLTTDQAVAAYRKAEGLLRSPDHAVDPEAVLRLAERSGCTAYDCEFVHVALALGVPLVTSDAKMVRAFPQVAVSMEEFAA